MDQTFTSSRPSPAGPLPARRSQRPGPSIPCPQAALPLTAPAAETALPPEPGEDPPRPGSKGTQARALATAAPLDPLDQPLAFLGGVTIALITALVPLASVMAERENLGSGNAVPAPTALLLEGSEQQGGLLLP
jgi:hypothetical protein